VECPTGLDPSHFSETTDDDENMELQERAFSDPRRRRMASGARLMQFNKSSLIENWISVPIDAYRELYQVSDQGRIRSRKGKILSPIRLGGGLVVVSLSAAGIVKQVTISSLVARAFLGTQPQWTTIGYHDSNKSNCSASNLYWLSTFDPRIRAGSRGKSRTLKPARSSVSPRSLAILAKKGQQSAMQTAKEFNICKQRVYQIWKDL
jgi:hypothetical protein